MANENKFVIVDTGTLYQAKFISNVFHTKTKFVKVIE